MKKEKQKVKVVHGFKQCTCTDLRNREERRHPEKRLANALKK